MDRARCCWNCRTTAGRAPSACGTSGGSTSTLPPTNCAARLTPLKLDGSPARRRFVPFTVRFHLHPQVSALVAQDRQSVLLKVEGAGAGWTLRTDAHEIELESGVHQQGAVARRTQQIVLRGQARLDAGAKLRWKLSAVATRVDGEEPAA
jgi:uncharacterized heparinase superfamily protein